MKAIWSGAVTFGLISIPVKLYSAIQEKSLKFHLLHEEDGGRIKYQRVCAKCGKEVSWDDVVKGFEYSKDHYVTFEEDELAALDVDSIKAVDVEAFVPLDQIDPVYFNKTYFLAPDAAGLKAYKLLADALDAERQVGVAKVALREKERLAAIRLKDDILVLETMYWPDEIREADFPELERNIKVRDAEVKMARQLIQQLSSDFKPEEFEDEYRVRLEEAVQQKVEGQEVTIAPEPEAEPTKVVDLMEALKASVEEAKKRKTPAREASKKKTSARKASAS